jgi:hypothetical protein
MAMHGQGTHRCAIFKSHLLPHNHSILKFIYLFTGVPSIECSVMTLQDGSIFLVARFGSNSTCR